MKAILANDFTKGTALFAFCTLYTIICVWGIGHFVKHIW